MLLAPPLPPPLPPPRLLEAGALEEGVDEVPPREAEAEPLEVLAVAAVVAAAGLEVEFAPPPEDLGLEEADDEKRLPRVPLVAAAAAAALGAEEDDEGVLVAPRPAVDGVEVGCLVSGESGGSPREVRGKSRGRPGVVGTRSDTKRGQMGEGV